MNLYKISEALNIRPQRLRDKAGTLNIIVQEDSTVSGTNAIKLVQSYLRSKKTSDDTKNRAVQFLNELTGTQSTKTSIIIGQQNKLSSVQRISSKRKSKKSYHTTIQISIDLLLSIYKPIRQLVQSIIQGSVQILESLQFKFIALSVAICVQMHHTANWFYRVSSDDPNWYAAYGYAFMVDLFILVITMEGKISIAKTFALLTFLSNILYFQFWVEFEVSAQAYTSAISSILISGTMAYIIYAYTEIFVKYRRNIN